MSLINVNVSFTKGSKTITGFVLDKYIGTVQKSSNFEIFMPSIEYYTIKTEDDEIFHVPCGDIFEVET